MSQSSADLQQVPHSLDPLSFPLHGSQLIEASAGTGKTFTIAALYVRLVLGAPGPAEQGLMPPDILVVTFTEAATKELRGRIRSRLAEAAQCFAEDPAEPTSYDDFLTRLRDATPVENWPQCARRLSQAAEWMDEAAVSTIHGWCKRMLSEYAFASGSLLRQNLETDQRELFAEVVRDYWRTFVVPLERRAAAALREDWAQPEDWMPRLRRLSEALDGIPEAAPPAESIAQQQGERDVVLARLKQPWAEWVVALRAALDAARERKDFNGSKLRQNHYHAWLDKLALWAADPDLLEPGLSDSAYARLTPDGLAEIWKEGRPLLSHPALDAMVELKTQLAVLPDLTQSVLYHAAHWVAQRMAQEKHRRAQMGFNDLLTQLDQALQGEHGAALAQRIRSAFPVALIDEFQDTDPLQYRIFDAVYRVADNDPDTALVLIGDPKQAIYAFRGADIHTYLQARHDCGARLHTLQRNFRSAVAMVEAVNRLFLHAEARSSGVGAFRFRQPDANPVPFVPATAAGRGEVLEVAGTCPPAMTVRWLASEDEDKAVGVGAYRTHMAAACADEMLRLIRMGQQGTAGFRRDDGSWRALKPGDLAVLVNAGYEAAEVRAALAQRGVRSVYLSDSESVFATAAAADLQLWLAACAEPEDGNRVRAALGSALLALPWTRLDQLNHDEQAWEACVQQFRDYRLRWQRQGVLPMVRQLLHDFAVPARLMGERGGERTLTDLLHLAELLQSAATVLDGEHAVLRYLREQRADSQQGGEDVRQQRLESDADLVQVVTVHKSKGLEYPLVFFPFAVFARCVEKSHLPLQTYDAQGQRYWLLEADADGLARADQERLSEDVRKVYVAVTRARHLCWMGAAPLEVLERSALGSLLHDAAADGALSQSGWWAELSALAQDGVVSVTELQQGAEAEASEAGNARAEADVPAEGDAEPAGVPSLLDPSAPALYCTPQRSVHEQWWIASYSALQVSGTLSAQLDPDTLSPAVAGDDSAETAREDVFHEAAQATVPLLSPSATGLSMHTFPRGPDAGSFLHDVLEWATQQGFAQVVADPAGLRDQIARRCARRGWTQWIDPLLAWMLKILTTPLVLRGAEGEALSSLCLRDLHRPVAEMEFWLQVEPLAAQALDQLVCAQTLGGAPRPMLEPRQLNGMLKGFMDLVFEHDGRYFVADYKSNWLGPDASAYTPSAITQAILGHRYELQYVLYVLALHRLLRSRLPDYDYDAHMGGAVYVFLRGIEGSVNGVHFECPPRALIESLDAHFRGVAQV